MSTPENLPPFAPADEDQCGAMDSGWHCTAHRDHGGPVHVAYETNGRADSTWPVTAKLTPEEIGARRAAELLANGADENWLGAR